MARIAVFHNTLDFQGGADAVCLATCEALLEAHDVTLVTLSTTDPTALAERFGVDVDGLAVRTLPGGDALASVLAAAAPWTGPQLALRSAVVHRAFARQAPRFDLAVSTANELSMPIPSVQYVHYPQFRLGRIGEGGRLNPLWSALAAPDSAALGDATLLANSAWTANVVDRVYGRRPTVVHPPVEAIDGGRDWTDRERGIVVVGRLAPDKRIHEAFAVLDRLRDRGRDVHLHVAGSAPRAYRRYVDRLTRMAARRQHASLERDVSRERLLELLRTHRYGLNLKPDEHFGMSVAEYVAAGMLAFAPDGGGQREILDGRADRLFDGLNGAVDRIDAAIAAGDEPSLPRERFGRERFGAAIREHVARRL
jgi:glycosyltransferase involved in cell wall biosynthesis